MAGDNRRDDHSLFQPSQLGDIALPNRIVMAPLTRNRASPGRVPNGLMQTYYVQRASAGLIVTEASQISAEGQGYLDTPGIYSPAQVAAWRAITDAVHAAGGRIVIQLWHVGRISHSSLLPDGQAPVSSTARNAQVKTFTANGFEDVSTPRALRTDELPRIVADYRHAARCAIEAGFDGVEVHGANGYLLDQFMRDSINDRTDAYGGSIENRARLTIEVMQAVIDEVGAARTGIRLSPVTPVNGAGQDSDPRRPVRPRGGPPGSAEAGVHPRDRGPDRWRPGCRTPSTTTRCASASSAATRPAPGWSTTATRGQMAIDVLAQGRADLVAFGRPFIANPDLVRSACATTRRSRPCSARRSTAAARPATPTTRPLARGVTAV